MFASFASVVDLSRCKPRTKVSNLVGFMVDAWLQLTRHTRSEYLSTPHKDGCDPIDACYIAACDCPNNEFGQFHPGSAKAEVKEF